MAIASSPLFAAIFFFFGAALRIVAIVRYVNRSHYDEEKHKFLNPSYLKKEWQFRLDESPLNSFSQFLNLLAWVFFAIPILQLAWVLSRNGRRQVRIHGAMAAFALAGVMTELISRCLVFGGKSTALWTSTSFNLEVWLPDSANEMQADNIGWRTLEVAYLIMNGLLAFVDSFEWICLSAILMLTAYSVATLQNQMFSIRWSRFGLVIAILCIFEFAGGIVLFQNHHAYTRFAVAVSVLNMLILLPIWLWSLAMQLPKALPAYIPARDTEPTRS